MVALYFMYLTTRAAIEELQVRRAKGVVMQDEWTTIISDGRIVKFTCSDLLADVAFMTAQIAGHEVVYSILSNKGVEVPFSRADVERRFAFELRIISN